MATEEHKRLAKIIKGVHDTLRTMAKEKGPEAAWEEHLKNEELLQSYAHAMSTLAGIWEQNAQNLDQTVKSRISWIVSYCVSYFFVEKIYLEKRSKEQRILEANELGLPENTDYLEQLDKVRLLDVGSCFNPFQHVENFEVTAIDLCPANETVIRGDFLRITVDDDVDHIDRKEISHLPANYFHCVVFSLLLEYIPSSEQRLECCRKAHKLLKTEGILIIITPDSQHVGKNARQMKNWRYTLAKMGFSRIKFEKLQHITCLVFRKAIDHRVTDRWADAHKEEYMTLSLDIPQDNKDMED